MIYNARLNMNLKVNYHVHSNVKSLGVEKIIDNNERLIQMQIRAILDEFIDAVY